MAQKVEVLLVDDLDGGTADETVTFALDGRTYEIDLAEDNATKLRTILEPYTTHARRSGGRSKRTRPSPPAPGANSADIRRWARDHGHAVSDRGRVPAEVREAYAKANA